MRLIVVEGSQKQFHPGHPASGNNPANPSNSGHPASGNNPENPSNSGHPASDNNPANPSNPGYPASDNKRAEFWERFDLPKVLYIRNDTF